MTQLRYVVVDACDFQLEARQCVEMGRPACCMRARAGKVTPPRISGKCVAVTSGVVAI